MDAAIALGERGRGRTAPNPNVGCIIVRDERIVGRGWTQDGGRPHAEAVALDQADGAARGATVYVTLEPCAHASARGPACADLLAGAKPDRVVVAVGDPDPRIDGRGLARLRAAGIAVEDGVRRRRRNGAWPASSRRMRLGRPFVTLKLALSIDGRIALASGESKWITGEEARAHAHLERARSDMILVGRGTYDADAPRLDVRLPGIEVRSPRRALLTRGEGVEGWNRLGGPDEVHGLADVNDLLVEGGAETAAAFLAADLVDRLLVYRAPILIGDGKAALAGIGLDGLAAAHGRWRLVDTRQLGIDTLEVYERIR